MSDMLDLVSTLTEAKSTAAFTAVEAAAEKNDGGLKETPFNAPTMQ